MQTKKDVYNKIFSMVKKTNAPVMLFVDHYNDTITNRTRVVYPNGFVEYLYTKAGPAKLKEIKFDKYWSYYYRESCFIVTPSSPVREKFDGSYLKYNLEAMRKFDDDRLLTVYMVVPL